MILLACSLSFMISIIDYQRMRSHTVESNVNQVNAIEDMVQQTLQTVEKVNYYYNDELAEQMRRASVQLIEKYEENPDFSTWDFQALKETYHADIYIINQSNTIIYSSFLPDMGLNFNQCCKKIAKVLENRRKSGEFHHDGIDLEQKTGHVKKYSYMATKDKKYLIQLGVLLENKAVFQEFDFLKANHDLAQKYPSIEEINVLNIAGKPFGKTLSGKWLTAERREAFNEALTSGEKIELEGEKDQRQVIYRYVPYKSEYDYGTTQQKVIEIIYNQSVIESILERNKQIFYIQLFIILTVTIMVAFVISKWMSRPMYLAFHDSLTGLKNRAAFDEMAREALDTHEKLALFMIDLDHFKTVNDCLGHDSGDQLLINVAKTINKTVDKKGEVYRYGGDEFLVVLYVSDREIVSNMAKQLLSAIQQAINETNSLAARHVTASIGISMRPEHGRDIQTLYKKADIALYQSKAKGKAQYQIFD